MRFLFGSCVFEPEAHRLTSAGRAVPLAPKPLALLAHLLSRRPSIVSVQELRDLLWPETFVGYNSLAQVVAALRRALGARGRGLIQTTYGVGYSFQGEVEEEGDPPRVPMSRPRWLNILGRTRAGVFVVDEGQRIILWNAGAERLLGRPACDVLGKACHEVIAGERDGRRWCRAGCRVQRVLRCGALPRDVEMLTHTRRGRPIPIAFSVLAVSAPGGPLAAHFMRNARTKRRVHSPFAS